MDAEDNKNTEDFIFVKADLAYYRIDLKDIYFIESLLNYVLIHTKNNSFKTLISLKGHGEKLPVKDFARIHNSYIVRIDKIAYIKYPQLNSTGKNESASDKCFL